MITLGLHKDPWHNSGAAIIRDDGSGPLFVNLAEERLDRKKDSRAFPQLSTTACMKQLGVASYGEIDTVVLDYIRTPGSWRKDYYARPCREDIFLADIPDSKIHIINHHLAHALAVFYSSPFDRAAILVIDGRGSDQETQSLFIGDENGISLLGRTSTIGIGLLYAAVTQLIGFGLLQEGKTMGLAPYGETINKRILDLPRSFQGIVTDYSAVCIEDSYALKSVVTPVETFEDKARAAWEVQQECEAAMCHLASYAKQMTGADYLCISGGVGLNSVANNKIRESEIFEDIFINPAASDTGIALGAALYGYHYVHKQPKRYADISAFLGPVYDNQQIADAVKRHSGFRVVSRDAAEHAASMLAANKIVAIFDGRSEMGPRALGHRSILMSPREGKNKDILTQRVKHRESFRPFAPAIPEELTQDYFLIDRPSPYMLLVPKVREDKRSMIPAVTHVDGTGRLQTVTAERNPLLYLLVKQFHELTGVPVLLNTSFNIAGEPIVETPDDAIRCFLSTDIDALLLEDTLLVKPTIDSPLPGGSIISPEVRIADAL
jgi:carbamoyltransferase